MKYVITDWMSNICFDSENLELNDFDEASQLLDESLLKQSPNLEACENEECACEEAGHECSSLDEERQEYTIEEYDEDIDRIMWAGTRYILRKNYFAVQD